MSGPCYASGVLGRSVIHPLVLAQLQTASEAVCRHTASRSGYLVLTDRQQTHQVPVKVHQEAVLEIHFNADKPPVWKVNALIILC